MAFILNIETATTVCSVSLAENGQVIAYREIDDGYTHVENLHVFIHQVLEETQLQAKNLQAIAVSKGPGSYTGLRIGVSAAKGMAYALEIPLLSVGTLTGMAFGAMKVLYDANAYYCPMIDARRMEVYCALFNAQLDLIAPVSAQIIEPSNLSLFTRQHPIYFFGDGMPKSREILSSLGDVQFINNIKPSAMHMAELSFEKLQRKEWEDVAYFEPFYLKDFLLKK